ncbi:hypothetical protein M514_08079 [Trichuris suis]|uniref:Uncharacterized protein n=1 Tax=Trichuris suis TaxID=68888 RepID=A0A085M1E2_9BILA|nr:hypothetical protein M513_08079 [Trichuris suis]KFD73253.1 hypothetical protein M514_08079 [Trichuris suis]
MTPSVLSIMNEWKRLEDDTFTGFVLLFATVIFIVNCCADKNQQHNDEGNQRKKHGGPLEERRKPSYIGRIEVIRESQNNEQTINKQSVQTENVKDERPEKSTTHETQRMQLFLTDDEPAPGYSSCLTPKAWDLPLPPPPPPPSVQQEPERVEKKNRRNKKNVKHKTRTKRTKKDRRKTVHASPKHKKKDNEDK